MIPRLLLCALFLSPSLKGAHPALEKSGIKGGVVVHLGAGDYDAIGSLRPSDSYIVQALDTDSQSVAAARKALRAKGGYGDISVERFDGRSLPYIENFVNLLVAENLGGVTKGEVMRVLVPEGKAHVKQGGEWQTWTKPRPDDIDDWTHFFHNPSGNAVAQDDVVAPPERLQWVGGPRWSRHHDRMASMSALVSGGGRMFYIMDEGLASVDSAAVRLEADRARRVQRHGAVEARHSEVALAALAAQVRSEPAGAAPGGGR